jgi:4-hydroxybenzoate polyprenyltransferase
MKQFFAYAQLVRLPNTFTAMADIFLGALATGWLSGRCRWFLDVWSRPQGSSPAPASEELQRWAMFLCLLAASTLLYWAGMVWNDYFDLEQDRRERPSRPLAGGRVSLRTGVVLGLSFLAAGVLFAALADLLAGSGKWRSLPIAGALVVAIFLYDGVLKKTWAGPILMGSCRFLNVLLGLTIVGGWPPAWGWLLALIIGTYICGVTWFARTEAQVSSKPMLIGAGALMLTSLVLALTVPALVLEIPALDFQPSRYFPYLLAAFGTYLGIAVIQAIRQPQPAWVPMAIKRSLLGLVVFDALLASAFVGTAGLLLIVLLIPGIVLGRWMYST